MAATVKKNFLLALGVFQLSTTNIVNAAEEGRPVDLSVKSGLVAGTISRPQSGTAVTAQTYNYSGVPLIVGLNRDLGETVSGQLGLGVLLDFGTNQIIKQSIDVSIMYHLIGGVREHVVDFNMATATVNNRFNLSPLARFGLYNIAATNQSNSFDTVKGSTFVVVIGCEARRDFSATSALGAEVSTTALSFSSDSNRLKINEIQALAFWRLLI